MVHNIAVVYELRRLDSGTLVRTYTAEGAALAFIRDVLRVAGRDQANGFALAELDDGGPPRPLASGAALVQRAVEDRAE